MRALAAGKHVLCEKPIALDAAEASQLIAVRERTGRLVQEAAMVRTHPRWLGARESCAAAASASCARWLDSFPISTIRPTNVRHQPGMGGGGLLDIGFYPITMARFIFEAEPVRVMGLLEIDPRFGVDRLASAILEFPRGHAIFTCSTQLVPHQYLDILGTRGRIGIEIPWSMPHERPSRLLVDDGARAVRQGPEGRGVWFPACDQWGVQWIASARPSPRATPRPCPSRTLWPTCAYSMRFFGPRKRVAGRRPSAPRVFPRPHLH